MSQKIESWINSIVNFEALMWDDGVWYLDGSKREMEGVYDEKMHGDLLRIEDKSWWFKHRNKMIETGINRYPPSENTIVDVGGGNGYVAAYLKDCGYKIVLFEPGIQGIINAKSRGIDNLICAPLNATTAKANSIGSIGIFDVLEHMENEREFLNEMYRALKPDGLIYITVPAHMFLWSDEDESAGHFRRYSLKSLCEVLTANGFEVLFGTYFFRLLALPIFIFRTLPYKLFKKNKPNNAPGNRLKSSSFIVPNFIERIMSLWLGNEIRKMKRGKISSGASIFVIAKKISAERM